MKLDNIHIDFSPIDGREKPLNIIMTSRHDGKTTTFLVRKHAMQWEKTHAPLVLLFRNIVDITPSAVNYYVNLINLFMDKPITLRMSKADLDKGVATAYLGKEPYFHCVALHTSETTLKKTAFPNVRYILFDELEINPKNGEKYLTNEYGKFQAYFDTQRKLTPNVKFYGLTNPYSLVNPYFRAWHVDTRKLKLGTMLVGDTWAVWYKRMNPLLTAKIKAENPLYSEEDEYVQMALNGVAINDLNNHVMPMRGDYYLDMTFQFQNVTYGIYRNKDFLDEENPLYYVQELKGYKSKRRALYAFDFDDMVCNSVLATKNERNGFAHLKMAIRNQDVGYDLIETEHAFLEIYNYL